MKKQYFENILIIGDGIGIDKNFLDDFSLNKNNVILQEERMIWRSIKK